MSRRVFITRLGLLVAGTTLCIIACSDGDSGGPGGSAGTAGNGNVAGAGGYGNQGNGGNAGTFSSSGCGPVNRPDAAAPEETEPLCFTLEQLASFERGAGGGGAGGGGGEGSGNAGHAGTETEAGAGGQAVGAAGQGGSADDGAAGESGAAGHGGGTGGEPPAIVCPEINWRTHPGLDTPLTIWRGSSLAPQGGECCYLVQPSCG